MKLSKLFKFSIFILMLAFIITSCGKKQEETPGTKSNSEKELAEFIKAKRSDFQNIRGLAYKRNGQIHVNERRPVIENLDELPFPETPTNINCSLNK